MTETKKQISYISGISGFKAFAALMVVFYHMKLPFAKGGLLGVTAFFAISGFLITRNLLREVQRNGKIRFTEFWKKRFKRIWPPLIFMIVITVLLFALFNRVLFTKECKDVLSVLTGTNNWAQIFSNISYFENAGAPSPLTHCWSLSIEIQFYLIISLLFLFPGYSAKNQRILPALLCVLSIISMVLMTVLFDPAGDPSRVYYGTDTRIFSLFAGCLTAIYETKIRSFLKNGLTASLLGILAFAAFTYKMITVSGYSAFMYRGGQILATLLCVLIIIALFNEDALFSKILSLKPLQWAGTHSYALYLWHYPLILLLQKDGRLNVSMMITVIAISVLMSVFSELFIELPVNSGMYSKSIKILAAKPRSEKGLKRQQAIRRAFVTLTSVQSLLVLSAVFCMIFVPKQSTLSNLEEMAEKAAEQQKRNEERAEQQAAEEVKPQETPAEETPETAEEVPVRSDEEITSSINLLMIGDSVALGASDEFASVFPSSICDASVSRYTTESYAIFDTYRNEQNWNGDAVIFALGANGMLYDSLPVLRSKTGAGRPLFVMTSRAPYTDWSEINNEEIRKFAEENEDTYLIDWFAASNDHPEYFVEDATHLTYEGTVAYTECIRQAVLEVFRTSAKAE